MIPLLFNQGFAYYDEGFILHAAQRMLESELPYLNFDLIYTPGTIFLTSLAFKLLGESIMTGRILSLLISIFASFLVFKISYRATKNIFAGVIAVLIYIAWGPTHINFPWPSLFAVAVGLLTVLAYPNYLLTGLLVFVVFLFKQNFGVASLLVILIDMVLVAKIRFFKAYLKLLLGFLTGLTIFLIYLDATDSLAAFLQNFYFYTIEGFLSRGVAATQFPSGIKFFFYLLPFFISLTAIYLYRKKPDLLIIPIFTLVFYLLGIRPTTDYPHLTVLMSISGLPISLIMMSFKNKIVLLAVISLISLGFYTALFKNYYRWDSPLMKQTHWLSHRRAQVYVDAKFSLIVPEILRVIEQKTKKDEHIFVFPNAPLFYFLSGRKNPTRFINLPGQLHTLEHEKQVIRDLKGRKVKLILTNEDLSTSEYKAIKKYIEDNYDKIKTISHFILWEKNDQRIN